MSFVRLRAEILAARDARQVLLDAALDAALAGAGAVFVATAIPGPRKDLAGSGALFRWALAELEGRLGTTRALLQDRWDILGPYAIVAVDAPITATKRACIAIEDACPPARLLDLDVYDAAGRRVGRVDLGQPPRACLLCTQPAADCMRLRRHAMEALTHHAEHLLATFRCAAAG